MYCYLEFKLSCLKNLKLFSISVKELFEPIVLRKKGDGFFVLFWVWFIRKIRRYGKWRNTAINMVPKQKVYFNKKNLESNGTPQIAWNKMLTLNVYQSWWYIAHENRPFTYISPCTFPIFQYFSVWHPPPTPRASLWISLWRRHLNADTRMLPKMFH